MITLINPPSPFLIDDTAQPPLGILYLAAYLEKHGVESKIVDLSGGDLIRKLDRVEDSDVFGVTSTTPQYGSAKTIRKFLYKKFEKPVIIGGPHVTPKADSLILDGWDKAFLGESERTLFMYLKTGGKLDGGFLLDSKPVEDIDSLPFPARNKVDIRSYRYKIGNRLATTAITSRSCPYSCSFCSRSREPLRLRSAENVNAEIDEIRSIHGFDAVMFYDDIFVMRLDRLEKIATHLKANDIIYRCFARANMVSDKTFELLGKTGCFEVGFGAESGSNRILKNIKKKTTVEQNTKLVKMAHDHGVRVKAFLIAGLPGETEETLDDTERWIVESGVDDFDITILTPYPGSEIYEHPEKFDIRFEKTDDWDSLFYKGKYGEYASHVETSGLTKERIVERRDKIERGMKKHG